MVWSPIRAGSPEPRFAGTYAPSPSRLLFGWLMPQAVSVPLASSPSESQTELNQLWLAPSTETWMRGKGSPGWMYWLRSNWRAPMRFVTSPSQ